MYTCTFCVAQGGSPINLTFHSESTWLAHLISDAHFNIQKQRPTKTFGNWDQKRTVLVSGIKGLTTQELIGFFAKFGDVQNFHYPKPNGTATNCKVLMADETSARKIHNKGSLTVGKTNFQVRLSHLPQGSSSASTPPVKQSQVSRPQVASITSTTSSEPESFAMERMELFLKLHDKPEGGFSNGSGFVCRMCECNVGNGEEQWVQHLMTEAHQDIHRKHQLLRKVIWDQDKTVLISNTKGASSFHILRYVIAFGGPVADFQYLCRNPEKGKCCYALMSQKEGAEKLAAIASGHTIGPKQVRVRMSLMLDKQKKKFLRWRENLIKKGNSGGLFVEEEEEEEEEEDIEPRSENAAVSKNDEISILHSVSVPESVQPQPDSTSSSSSVPTALVVDEKESGRKRKVEECKKENSVNDNNFQLLKGLSVENQLQVFRDELGWGEEFLSGAVQFIDKIVSRLCLKFRKFPFGDFCTGLGLQGHPTLQVLVDVHEVLEKNVDANAGKSAVTTILTNCSKILQDAKGLQIEKVWISEQQPQLCVSTNIRGINTTLQLLFSNITPLQECKLFHLYCDYDKRISSVGFLLSAWAVSNNYLQNTKQSYPNQFVILLLLTYLQHKKLVPTIRHLQEILTEDTEIELVNGINMSFCSNIGKIKRRYPNPLDGMLADPSLCATSALGLLKEWFEFFAVADLKDNAVCPRFGYFLPKTDFHKDSFQHLPADLASAYQFDHEKPTPKKLLFSQTPLCIQHPFELGINCSRTVTPNEVSRFQNGCKTACEALSAIIMSDEPNLINFLIPGIPTLEDKFENKKAKTDNLVGSVDRLVTSAPTSSHVTVSSPPKPPSSSTASTPLSKAASGSDSGKTRSVASDFFEKLTKTKSKVNEEIEEKDEVASNFECVSDDASSISVKGVDVEDGECTFVLNLNLYRFFAAGFSGTEDLKYRKLQLLVLQIILDFNQKFWANCIGLQFLPKVAEKYWPEEYAKVLNQGKVPTQETILQRVMAIQDAEKSINLGFRVKSNSSVIHKAFTTEFGTMKQWASGRNCTELSLLLYDEVPMSRRDKVKASVFVRNDTEEEFTLDCRLVGEISESFQNRTPLATLTIGLANSGINVLNHLRINLIKKVYRKLGMTYINKMVKRWLYEASDFDHVKAQSFIENRNQRWNAKAKKKRNQAAKKQQNFGSGRGHPRGGTAQRPLAAQKNPSSGASANSSQVNPNVQPRFSSQPVNRGRGSGRGRGQQYRQPLLPHPPAFITRPRLPTFSGNRGSFPQFSNPTPTYQNQPHYASSSGVGDTGFPLFQQHSTNASHEMPERILRNPGSEETRLTYQNQPISSNNRTEEPSISKTHLPPPLAQYQPSNTSYPSDPRLASQNTYSRLPEREVMTAAGGPALLPLPYDPRVPRETDRPFYQQEDNFRYPHPSYQEPPVRSHPDFPQRQQSDYDEERQKRYEAFVNAPPSNKNYVSKLTQDHPIPNVGRSSERAEFERSFSRRSRDIVGETQPSNEPDSRYGHFGSNPRVAVGTSFIPSDPRATANSQSIYSREPIRESGYDGGGTSTRVPRYTNQGSTERSMEQYEDHGNYYSRPARPNVTNAERVPYERPLQPRNKGFIRGGLLSQQRQRGDSDSDDELHIVFETDPKSSSSPPPPPTSYSSSYKVGAPFPVPGRSSMMTVKSPLSHVSRNPDGYETVTTRSGYLTAPGSRAYGRTFSETSSDMDTEPFPATSTSPTRRLYMSGPSGPGFQGFGINPSEGDRRY